MPRPMYAHCIICMTLCLSKLSVTVTVTLTTIILEVLMTFRSKFQDYQAGKFGIILAAVRRICLYRCEAGGSKTTTEAEETGGGG